MLVILSRTVLFIILGISIASIIAETGVFAHLSILLRPLRSVSRLSGPAATSVTAMLLNATAGKSMLAEFYRKGTIDQGEIIPALIIGTFPTVLGESLFRIHLPTALVILGPVVGTLHVLLNLFSSFIQATVAVIYIRLFLQKQDQREETVLIPDNPFSPGMFNRKVVFSGMKKAVPSIVRVVSATVAATLIFFLIVSAGFGDLLGVIFGPILKFVGLPGESTAALAAEFFHFSAGYAVVASLMMEGVLGIKEALITLVLGSMIIITMIYAKYSVPLYISLFGRYGLRIASVTYAASMGAKILILGIIQFLL